MFSSNLLTVATTTTTTSDTGAAHIYVFNASNTG